MFKINAARYPARIAELATEERLNPLDPGQPNREARGIRLPGFRRIRRRFGPIAGAK